MWYSVSVCSWHAGKRSIDTFDRKEKSIIARCSWGQQCCQCYVWISPIATFALLRINVNIHTHTHTHAHTHTHTHTNRVGLELEGAGVVIRTGKDVNHPKVRPTHMPTPHTHIHTGVGLGLEDTGVIIWTGKDINHLKVRPAHILPPLTVAVRQINIQTYRQTRNHTPTAKTFSSAYILTYWLLTIIGECNFSCRF